jgi:hypothetical protein
MAALTVVGVACFDWEKLDALLPRKLSLRDTNLARLRRFRGATSYTVRPPILAALARSAAINVSTLGPVALDSSARAWMSSR